MQTKTYFASSVPAALEVARQELGEDALLVSSRPAPLHARQFGRLEVTFAWEPQARADPSMGAVPLKAGESCGRKTYRERFFRRDGDGNSCRSCAQAWRHRYCALSTNWPAEFRLSPFAALNRGESRTLAFIGPPGRGKTTRC